MVVVSITITNNGAHLKLHIVFHTITQQGDIVKDMICIYL